MDLLTWKPTRPRTLLAVSAAVVVGVVLSVVVVRTTSNGSGGQADRVLAPLPTGYVYATMEEDDRDATAELFRNGYGADDVAVALVGTPEDLAPVGVAVVVLVLRRPPDPLEMARRMEKDVTLVDPKPKTLASQPVLGHEGDATFSSATLWVRERLAILTYGATTAEVDGVMEALLTAGRWRDHPAA